MKSIAITHLTAVSDIGGAEQLIFNLINEHKAKFHNIAVNLVVIGTYGELNRRCERLGITTKSLGLKSIIQIPHVLILLLSTLKENKTVILHTHLFLGGVLGALAKILMPGLRLIHTRHYLDSYGKSWKLLPRQIGNICLTNKFSDKLIAISGQVYSVLVKEKISQNKILLIENGIPEITVNQINQQEKFTHAILTSKIKDFHHLCPGGHVIYNVGMFRKHKGQEHIIQLLNYARAKNFPLFCILIGDGPKKPQIEKMCSELNLDSQVCFLGVQRDPIIFLDNSDILLHLPDAEGFGLVICEAMRDEKMIVAAKVGGICDIIDNNETGFLVDPLNLDEQFKMLKKVCELSDEQKKKIKKQALEKFVERYTIERCHQKYVELYFS